MSNSMSTNIVRAAVMTVVSASRSRFSEIEIHDLRNSKLVGFNIILKFVDNRKTIQIHEILYPKSTYKL